MLVIVVVCRHHSWVGWLVVSLLWNLALSSTVEASPQGGDFQTYCKSVATGPSVEVCAVFSSRDLTSAPERRQAGS